jgi:tetratricopeptide (TPR) repeat protein
LQQGDLLIWLDRQPFVDSRVALYAGSGRENLLELHDRTRRALRQPRGDQEYGGRRDVWRETFDRFEITHAVPRLGGKNPDYVTHGDLFVSPDWQLARLGAAASVYYRTDLDGPDLQQYLVERRVDFVDEAFRAPAADPLPRTDMWATSRSLYERYLPRPDTSVPGPIQHARHYQIHAEAAGDPSQAAALAHLAIRKANEGLAENPNFAEGYRTLGNAYRALGVLEAEIARQGGGSVQPWRRFQQAVHAYGQALVIEPDDPVALGRLFELYLEHGKADLALDALDRFIEIAAEQSNLSPEELRLQHRQSEMRRQLSEGVERVIAECERLLERETDRLNVAQFAYQQSCILHALELLDADPDLIAGNPQAQLFRALLLTEAGRPRQASELLASLEVVLREYGPMPWRSPTARTSLAIAEYGRAVQLWTEELNELKHRQMQSLMQPLPLVSSPQGWPVRQIQLAWNALFELPEQAAALQFEVALCHLETGNVKAAESALREIVEANPETMLRPLVRFYLYLVTDELIDREPPSERIPVGPWMFGSDESTERD